jgi:hypothetical protein
MPSWSRARIGNDSKGLFATAAAAGLALMTCHAEWSVPKPRGGKAKCLRVTLSRRYAALPGVQSLADVNLSQAQTLPWHHILIRPIKCWDAASRAVNQLNSEFLSSLHDGAVCHE